MLKRRLQVGITTAQLGWRAFFGLQSHEWNSSFNNKASWNGNAGGATVGFHQYMSVNLIANTLTGKQWTAPPTSAETAWPRGTGDWNPGGFAMITFAPYPPFPFIAQFNSAIAGPNRAGRWFGKGFRQQSAHNGPPAALTVLPVMFQPPSDTTFYVHIAIWDSNCLPSYQIVPVYTGPP